MTTVFAVALVIGILALIGWMVAHSLATSQDRPDRDPEERFGVAGRRVVAGLVGFGMAGMSADFAALDLSAPVVAGLAVLGAAVAAWWAGFAGGKD